jgi:LemA protein
MNAKIIVAAVAIIAVILVGSFGYLYIQAQNNLAALNETVGEKLGQVEQELQRRYDLIPNLVASTRAYLNYEASVLENVTALRSQWNSAVASKDVDQINSATSAMESGISSIIVSIEAYPNLQSQQVVSDLMSALEGTENRISTERMRYNEAVRDYNTVIAQFPTSLWAAGWGYERHSYFQAQVGSTEVPQVDL